jgi:hypothetical protein
MYMDNMYWYMICRRVLRRRRRQLAHFMQSRASHVIT